MNECEKEIIWISFPACQTWSLSSNLIWKEVETGCFVRQEEKGKVGVSELLNILTKSPSKILLVFTLNTHLGAEESEAAVKSTEVANPIRNPGMF